MNFPIKDLLLTIINAVLSLIQKAKTKTKCICFCKYSKSPCCSCQDLHDCHQPRRLTTVDPHILWPGKPKIEPWRHSYPGSYDTYDSTLFERPQLKRYGAHRFDNYIYDTKDEKNEKEYKEIIDRMATDK